MSPASKLIDSLDNFTRMLSRIYRIPSREQVITFDEMQQRVKNIKHVWSMQLLLNVLEIALQSSARSATKRFGAILIACVENRPFHGFCRHFVQ